MAVTMYPGAHPRDRPAQIMGTSGARRSFGELHAAARRYAGVFRACGLHPGDAVALCAENHPEYLSILWGAHYAGLLYTAISSRLGAEELAYIVEDCGARVCILSAQRASLAARVAELTPGVRHRFSLGDEMPGWPDLVAAAAGADPFAVDPDGPSGRDMLYSSGTTGLPKGIRPRDLTASLADPHLITPILQGLLNAGERDVYLSPAPLCHAAPVRFCMAMQQLGATVVVMERFTPGEALALIERHGITLSQMVPTMFVRLLRMDAGEREAYDRSTLRGVVHAGAPCPPQVKREMIQWLGPILHEYYSSTEASGLTWITSEEWLAHPGSVGRALLGAPHIVDADTGTELGVGETGLVFFSDGPDFAYHNDPEKTRSAHDHRGWSTVGDVGHLDPDGFLYLTDRLSFTIITGGVNVYPQEAENVLQSHPAVIDAAVFGVPDAEFGERVHAVVQPVAMPADELAVDALAAALIDACRARLADVKCPRSLELRATLPRHETGKLYKRLLRAEFPAAAGRS